jgi:serralysin
MQSMADTAPMPAQFPLADTLKLHSMPTASKRIYLDFDGHVTSDPSWNAGQSFTTPAYSVDGNTAFSDTELQSIQDIWARVSEDFSPFLVDVTTEEPGPEDLANTGGSDTRWGIRVVIGPNTGWYRDVGGVAQLYSFAAARDIPCFVFSDAFGTSFKSIAEAASHEVGHTLGLIHDGRPGVEYYVGHGSGKTGWAPIMGVGYYQSLSQWSRGDYEGANNKEDDLSIITGNNGFGYRNDDYGDAPSAAEPVVTATISGVIERNTDMDVFAFSTSGSIQATIKPIQAGANLDVLAEILDSTGIVVAASNPIGAIDASFNFTVSPGTYYLRVQGTGEGDPLTTGYTKYGSLGQYTVTFDSVQPPPEVVVMSIDDVAVIEGNAGETVARMTVTLSKASEQTVTVQFKTQDGTAKVADDDYVAVPAWQTLTFAPGETTQTIDLRIIGDERFEKDEAFSVVLSNAIGGYIFDGEGTCTILNDDRPITRVQVLPAVGIEPAAGGISTAFFTLKISGDVVAPVVISYATRDQSASARMDYRPLAGTFVIYPGQQEEKRIWVSIFGDRQMERDETFSLVVSSAGNRDVTFSNPVTGQTTSGNVEATGWILDNNSRVLSVRPTAPSVTLGNNASFTISLRRLAGYGEALPSPQLFAGIAPAQRASILEGIRFVSRYAVASGMASSRERLAAMAASRAGTAELGYVPDGNGGFVPKTSLTVEIPTAVMPRGRTMSMWLFNAVGARLDRTSMAQMTVLPTVEAAFASFGPSTRSPSRR